MDDKLYQRIVKRMEEDKIPVYPGIIRKKAFVRYKAEKEAELERKQKEYKTKIEEERERRVKAERERQKKWEEQQEVVKKVRSGSWVRINPDGSVSGAGEAAYSPSEAKSMGYKWGTTVREDGKDVFVPLPAAPTEAEYLGVLEWKVKEGHYKKPEIERQIKQEVELGGKKYGITAPAWASGYMKQYETAAKTIKSEYQKAAKSQKTPSGYELKEITLGKEGKGLRFGYVSKPPPIRKPLIEPEQTKEPTLVAPKKGIPTGMTFGPLGRKIKEGGMPSFLLQDKVLRHPAYVEGTVTAIPKVYEPGVVSTFLGFPARKQKKVVDKELSDVLTKESEYIEEGWIKPVLPTLEPEDIGKIEIIGEYKDKGFTKPTPQLEMQFVGSSEYHEQLEKVKKLDVAIKSHVKEGVYISPAITEFEKKWKPYTKGEFFSGTKEQHAQYLKEGDIASKKQKADITTFHTEIDVLKGLEGKRDERYKALTKEYDEYDVAAKEYKRLHGLSLIGKYETKEAEYGRRLSPVTSFIKETKAYAETPEVKALSERSYATHRRLFGLPPEPFEWEKKLKRIESEHKIGIVEGMAEKPLKTAVTAAAFFVLPPVLKGVRMAAKPAVVAGTKVFPRAMPWAAKWTPRAVGVGLGGMYGYSIEERIRAAPPEKRVREFGKITGTELLPMAIGTYAGMKAIPSIVKGAEVTPEGAVRTYKGLGLGEYKRPVVGMFRETTKTPKIDTTQKALVFGEKYPALRYLKEVQRSGKTERGLSAFGEQTYKEVGIGKRITFESKRFKSLFGKEGFLPEVGTTPTGATGTDFLRLPSAGERRIVPYARGETTALARIPTQITKYIEFTPKKTVPRGLRIERRGMLTYKTLIPERLYGFEAGYKAFQIGKYPKWTKVFYEKGRVPKTKTVYGKKVEDVYPSDWIKKHSGIKTPSKQLALEEPYGHISTEIAHIGKGRVEITPEGPKVKLGFISVPVRTYARGYKPLSLPEWFKAPAYKGFTHRVEFRTPEELVGTELDVQKIKASDILKELREASTPEMVKRRAELKHLDLELGLAKVFARKLPPKRGEIITEPESPDVSVVRIPKFDYEPFFGVKAKVKIQKAADARKVIEPLSEADKLLLRVQEQIGYKEGAYPKYFKRFELVKGVAKKPHMHVEVQIGGRSRPKKIEKVKDIIDTDVTLKEMQRGLLNIDVSEKYPKYFKKTEYVEPFGEGKIKRKVGRFEFPWLPENIIVPKTVRISGVGRKVGRIPSETKITDLRKISGAEIYKIIGESEKVIVESGRAVEKAKYADMLETLNKARVKRRMEKMTHEKEEEMWDPWDPWKDGKHMWDPWEHVKTMAEKEAGIRAKIESGEYTARKGAKGMITFQKVITKQKVKPVVKEVTTVAEKAQKDLSKLISGERPKYKVKQKTIFEQFEEIRTKAPQIGTMVRPIIKPQHKYRVFPAFFPAYDYKEKEEAKISEKYEYEPLTLLGQRYKPFQPVALKHDVGVKEKARLAFVPFAGQAYKHEPVVEQKTIPVEKFAFKEMNILDRIFEKPPVPPIPPRQPFKLPTPPYIKPKKDKKLKPRRRPFGAYQLDVTNPILSPVDLLRMMGGLK